MDEIVNSHTEYKLYYEQWHHILDVRAYMSSLFCEDCLVAEAVVVRLRFAVENVPTVQREPLVPHWTRVTVCISYSRDLELVGPFF